MDHLSRLTARLSENLAERSKDLGLPLSLDALSNPSTAAAGFAGGLGKGLWDDVKLLTPEGERETRKLLEARSEREREEGLRRVVAMMCKNRPVLSYFPSVTNCLHSPTFTTPSTSPTSPLTTRHLVSIYILRHASLSPDLALLSVNAYQKDLTDPNPAVRALALRTLAGMGLETTAPLVLMSVGKAARDGSWWVRRAAAEATLAVFKLDPSAHRSGIIEGVLPILLADRSALVLGSALEVFERVCPGRWDLLHQHYRRYCRMLVDADEWGQLVIMRILTRYARAHFQDPELPSASSPRGMVDPDLDLLLRSTALLLQSRTHAVVLGAVDVYAYLAPSSRLSTIVPPLVNLLLSSATNELYLVTLQATHALLASRPDSRTFISPHLPCLFLFSADAPAVKSRKLRLLVLLAEKANAELVLKEFKIYVGDCLTSEEGEEWARETVAAVGEVVLGVGGEAVTKEGMKILVELLRSKHDTLISSAILVLRRLLLHPSQSSSRVSTIAHLTHLLISSSHIHSPPARATIYWLVGQFAPSFLESVAPDLLRVGVKGFADEGREAKLQILVMGAKLLVASHMNNMTPHRRFYALTFRYVTTLARYDLDYEVRDRARFLKGLVEAAGIVAEETEEAKIVLEAEAFARGEQVEQLIGGQGEGETEEVIKLRVEEVRQILFDRKQEGGKRAAEPAGRIGGMTGFFVSHALEDPSPLPPWTTLVLDSRVRDFDDTSVSQNPTGASATSRNSNLRGFGSDSFGNSGGSGGSVDLDLGGLLRWCLPRRIISNPGIQVTRRVGLE